MGQVAFFYLLGKLARCLFFCLLASWDRPEWARLLFLNCLVVGLGLSGPGYFFLLLFGKWSRFSFLVLLAILGQISVGPASAEKRVVVNLTTPSFKNLVPNPNFFFFGCECCFVF